MYILDIIYRASRNDYHRIHVMSEDIVFLLKLEAVSMGEFFTAAYGYSEANIIKTAHPEDEAFQTEEPVMLFTHVIDKVKEAICA